MLKGYAEENGGRDLYTRSPTASRLAQRFVIFIASIFGYRIASLDVSSAFLQGFTFEQLKEGGILGEERSEFAFDPPRDLYDRLA